MADQQSIALNTTPVGTPFLQAGSSLRCVRELYLLVDDEGRTWLAVGPDDKTRPGGVMPHLRAGSSVRVQSTNAEGLIVRLPQATDDPPEAAAAISFGADLPAYLIPSALMPSLEDSGPFGGSAPIA